MLLTERVINWELPFFGKEVCDYKTMRLIPNVLSSLKFYMTFRLQDHLLQFVNSESNSKRAPDCFTAAATLLNFMKSFMRMPFWKTITCCHTWLLRNIVPVPLLSSHIFYLSFSCFSCIQWSTEWAKLLPSLVFWFITASLYSSSSSFLSSLLWPRSGISNFGGAQILNILGLVVQEAKSRV